jgi:regulator of RNase E activity RraA
MKKSILLLFALVLGLTARSQNVVWPAENVKALSPEWTGERTADGRPKVDDKVIDRLKALSMEEVWGFLSSKGYENQFENFASMYENGWQIIHPDQVMAGRVVTAQFMPLRKDLDNYVQEQAKKEGTKSPVTNYAPIIKLLDGDVYVADSYGKMVDGTLIGDNLGNAINNAGHRGIIFNGSVRDIEGLSEINGFNGWVRGADPSYIKQMMIANVNGPIRIGRATVLPGDVVLAKKTGVVFIPAHLVQECVISGEYTALRDEFSFFCQKTKKYEYVNEAFVVDKEVFEKDFQQWLDAKTDLPMPRQELNDYIAAQKAKRAERAAQNAQNNQNNASQNNQNNQNKQNQKKSSK